MRLVKTNILIISIYLIILIIPTLAGNLKKTKDYDNSDTLFTKFTWQTFFNSGLADSIINPEFIDYTILNACIFHATNMIRERNRLKYYTYDSNLSKSAAIHTKEMVNMNFFGHENPYSKKYKTLLNRVNYVGIGWNTFNKFAENLGYMTILNTDNLKVDYVTIRINSKLEYYEINKNGDKKRLEPLTYKQFAFKAVNYWLGSRKHRKNILHKNLNSLGCVCLIDKKTINRKNKIPMVIITQNFGEIK